VLTPAQIRAARALIGWKQVDLAKAAGISEITLKNIERGVVDPRVSTIDAIQKAFDAAGVIFLQPGDIRPGGAGLRFKG
jgi:predicted transcriptional regulator